MKIRDSFRGPGGRFAVLRSEIPDGNSRYGETSFVNQEVRIGRMTKADRFPEVLVHELLHVAAEATAVNIKEDHVKTLAYALTDYLQQLGIMPDEMEIAEEGA